MNFQEENVPANLVWELKIKIEELERSVADLGELGKGLPMIERNVCSLYGLIHVLKKDVSDAAELSAPDEPGLDQAGSH